MAMDVRSSNSLFTHIASRELFRGFSRTQFLLENSQVFFLLSFSVRAVRKRPRMDGFVSAFDETGYVAVHHNAEDTIPLSLSFGKVFSLMSLSLLLYIWLLPMFCISVCDRGFCHVVTVFWSNFVTSCFGLWFITTLTAVSRFLKSLWLWLRMIQFHLTVLSVSVRIDIWRFELMWKKIWKIFEETSLWVWNMDLCWFKPTRNQICGDIMCIHRQFITNLIVCLRFQSHSD